MAEVILPISVVVHTKNAAATLEACLKSVSWATDIVIVDMQSTDATLSLAKKYTDHIVSVDDVGFADPMRNFGITQAKEDWVLVLDADEEAPPNYPHLLPSLMTQFDAWYLPRKNIIFGKWIQHALWWPDFQLRFFKKGTVLWSDKVHVLPSSTVPTGTAEVRAENALIHHNYQSINEFIDRLNRYTSLELNKRNGQETREPLLAAGDEFVKRYFQNDGYLDNPHGLYITLLQAFYEMVVRIKQWEKTGYPETKIVDRQQFKEIYRNVCYWLADREVKTQSNLLMQGYWRVRRRFKI